MDENIKLYAVCNFCWQKVEVDLFTGILYRCPFCHQSNMNPFYKEGNISMKLPKRDRKGRFIKEKKKHFSDDLAKPEIKKEQKKQSYWEVEIDCVDECSKVQNLVEISFKPVVKTKVQVLMDKFPNIEWLVYLLGEERFFDGEKDYIINDITIPIQTVSASNVWDIDCPEYNNLPIVGVMHSHHGMGTGFSKTDHDFINSNHNISLVISNNKIAGQVRIQTPCGSIKIVNNVKIIHLLDDNFDKETFLAEIKNITSDYQGNSNKKIKELNNAQKSYTNGNSVKDFFNEITSCPDCGRDVFMDQLRCDCGSEL